MADNLSKLSRLNQDRQTTSSTDAAITIEYQTLAIGLVFHWIVISLLASLFRVMGAPLQLLWLSKGDYLALGFWGLTGSVNDRHG